MFKSISSLLLLSVLLLGQSCVQTKEEVDSARLEEKKQALIKLSEKYGIPADSVRFNSTFEEVGYQIPLDEYEEYLKNYVAWKAEYDQQAPKRDSIMQLLNELNKKIENAKSPQEARKLIQEQNKLLGRKVENGVNH